MGFILCKLVLLHPEKEVRKKNAERENNCSLKIHPGGKISLLNPSKARRVTLNGTLHLVLPSHLLYNLSRSGK